MSMAKPLTCLLALLMLVLCGCNTQTKFASSFGKRRYTKGFYCDRVGAIKQVASTKAAKAMELMPIIHSSLAVVTKAVKEINRYVAMPLLLKPTRTQKNDPMLAVNIQAFVKVKDVPAVSSINSHHYGTVDGSKHSHGSAVVGAFLIILSIVFMVTSFASMGSGFITAGAVLSVIIGVPLFLVGVILLVSGLANN
jgi:hypothetical protein